MTATAAPTRSTTNTTLRTVRVKWAAIGAAIAITFSGSGLALVNAAGGGTASSFTPITPTRVLDTRLNIGLTGPFTSPTGRNLRLTGTIPTTKGPAEVVPVNATAVVLNVTAVTPQAAGYIAIRPAGTVGPAETSNLNFAAGQTVPNAVTVALAGDGTIEIIYDGSGQTGPTTDILVDVTGYYAAGAAGATGPAGPQGPAGAPGPAGPAGAAAPTGAGAVGSSCAFGGAPGTVTNLMASDGSVTTRCFRALTTTLSGGSNTAGFFDGTGGASGSSRFNFPGGLGVDPAGNVYVAELGNVRIRKIAANGTTTTLTGNGNSGVPVDGTGGPNGTTTFNDPRGATYGPDGNVYVADGPNHRIRKVAPDGSTTTLAGSAGQGFADGAAGTARFSFPNAVAVDASNNVYVADFGNNRIRKIASDGTTSTLAGGSNIAGYFDGSGGPTGTTRFNGPTGVAVDTLGNVYVADSGNNRIRKISPDGTTVTLAGGSNTSGYVDGTGGPTGTARFNKPNGIAVDTLGNAYVTDALNNRIRKIAPDGTTTTLAGGSNTAGFFDGTGGAAGTTRFSNPSGIAVDALGNVYVSDANNNRIRKISA
jgi:hypothetical protein